MGMLELLEAAERWLLPPECLACHQAIPGGEGDALICHLCRTRWRPLVQPQCEICGEPLLLGLECRLCRDWPAGLGPVRSAVQLDPSARRLVHALKYQGWSRLAESFASRMVQLLRDVPAGAILIPIPIAARRRRARGYNQAEVLARAIGAESRLPVAPDRLIRVRETPSQTRLGPEWRRANLAGAFQARPTPCPVILVDDVFTTGATLVSAALALLEEDCPEVRGLTFARAEAPLATLADRL